MSWRSSRAKSYQELRLNLNSRGRESEKKRKLNSLLAKKKVISLISNTISHSALLWPIHDSFGYWMLRRMIFASNAISLSSLYGLFVCLIVYCMSVFFLYNLYFSGSPDDFMFLRNLHLSYSFSCQWRCWSWHL